MSGGWGGRGGTWRKRLLIYTNGREAWVLAVGLASLGSGVYECDKGKIPKPLYMAMV